MVRPAAWSVHRGLYRVTGGRTRLWARWRELDAKLDTKLDTYAALRSAETAVVILEPRADRVR